MSDNEGFSGRVSILYVEIVKYFSLILSTLFLIATIVVIFYSITFPHHEEFKPAYVAKSFIPQEKSLTDFDKIQKIADDNCKGVESYSLTEDETIKVIKSRIASDFNGESDGSNNDELIKYGTSCLLRMAQIYGISNLNEWNEYNESVLKNIKTDYIYFSLANQTMQQYQKLRAIHDSNERDWGVSLILLPIAGGLFFGFVVSCMLLLLVRIERNTRR
ncbi:hypothetical protein [Yersinia enterocolitica]|uniref:hypothetical protein n=1 Tax=Yersinia enterocolitica TaxID=630 RepID=UPI003D0228C6